MLFSKISLVQFAALPLLVAGVALPADGTAQLEKRSCLVNARQRDEWVENGLTRWRAVFSSENTNTGAFCNYWNNEFFTNVQCGWSAAIDGGTWFVDVSYARGPVGDAYYWDALADNLKSWIKDTGCGTG